MVVVVEYEMMTPDTDDEDWTSLYILKSKSGLKPTDFFKSGRTENATGPDDMYSILDKREKPTDKSVLCTISLKKSI